MLNYTDIKYVTVHPTHLSVHTERRYDYNKSYSNETSLHNLRKNTHRNLMSLKAISKCKRSINYLLLQSNANYNYSKLNWRSLKFKISFVTLTLSAPQMHTDNQIKRDMLNPFLIEAKRLWGVQHYVWRAEKQINGNIHFHLLFDKFIPWHEIRGLWNHLQNKLGYISAYRSNQIAWHSSGFKVREDLLSNWPLKSQLKAYHLGVKNNWSDPNSTDVHSVKLVNNVAAYCTKYMTKDYVCKHVKCKRHNAPNPYKYEKIYPSVSHNALKFLRSVAEIGRLWGCSHSLSNVSGGKADIDASLEEELGKVVRFSKTKCIEENFYSVYIIDIKSLIQLRCKHLIELLSEYVTQRFILNNESDCFETIVHLKSLYSHFKISQLLN